MNDNKKRVLFLGNSYIFVNDLPYVFSELSESGGYSIESNHITRGGARLENFLDPEDALSGDLHRALIESRWDFVVLQEQSQIPSMPEERESRMYPTGNCFSNYEPI